MLQDMSLDGACITSISALDEQGREGGAYLWTEDQLKQLLDTEDLALLSKIWGMETAAEFEYGYLPMNRKTPADTEQVRLKVIYGKLLKARNERVAPRDIKLLSGLNGLALEAFSEAAELAPRYRQAADTLRNFMLEKLWLNGELQKGISKQQLLGPGDLESYAFAASGLRHYANLINKKADDKIARQITSRAWDKFYTPSGFVLEQGIELAKPYFLSVVEDSPLPSPSAVLIKTSLQAGNQLLRAKATSALAEGDALQKHAMFWVATQVIALNRLFEGCGKP